MKNEYLTPLSDIPEVWELTAQHPQIFSYAYSIPNPHVSEEAINGLIHLFSTGVWDYPDATHRLIYQLGYRPWQLWEEWESWSMQQYGNLPINVDEAARRFPNFEQTLISILQSYDSSFLDSADIFTSYE